MTIQRIALRTGLPSGVFLFRCRMQLNFRCMYTLRSYLEHVLVLSYMFSIHMFIDNYTVICSYTTIYDMLLLCYSH